MKGLEKDEIQSQINYFQILIKLMIVIYMQAITQ